MARGRRTRAWLGVALLLGGLAAGSAAHAQESAPAPAAVEPIPIGELRARADDAQGEVRRLMNRTAELGALDEINASVAAARQELKAHEAELAQTLQSTSSLDTLVNSARAWQELDGRLAARGSELEARAATLASYLQRLDARLELWRATAEAAQAGDAPGALVETARATRREIEQARDQLRRTTDQVLRAQDQVRAGRETVASALRRIAATQQELLANLWRRDREPLWAMGEEAELDRVAARFSQQISSQIGATLQLARDQWQAGLFHVLGIAALGMVLRGARQRTRAWSTENPRLSRVALAFEHPYAIALLIGLACTRLVYTSPPIAVLAFAELLLLFPALVVIEPLVERSLRPALFLLGGFYILDQLREFVSLLPVVSRGLFTLQMLLGLGVTSWLLVRERRGRALVDDSRVGEHPAAPLLLRGALGVFGVAFLCALLGFMRLGQLLGDGVLGSAYAAILLYATYHALQAIIAFGLRSRTLRPIHTLSQNAAALDRGLGRLLAAAGVVCWGLVVLELFGLRDYLGSALRGALDARLQVGSFGLSLGGVLAFGITIGVSLLFARGLQQLLEGDIYPRLGTQRGPAYAVSTVMRYTTIAAGFLIAVSAVGFDMDRLTVLVGAFGVGIGFGMQTVVNNFVSGLILLFERPIQLGDTVEADGVTGTVYRIGIRASIVRTFDGSDVSIPNGLLLSERVVNWTKSDRHRRIEVTVTVANVNDPEAMIALLETAAKANPKLLDMPRPQALFTGFGATTLDFALRAWVRDTDDWVNVRSDLLRDVHRRMVEKDIELPAPPATPARSVPSGT